MEVFHGTTQENADCIIQDGFRTENTSFVHPVKMINDLGTGVYSYCEDNDHLWNPKTNALKYARAYRNSESNKYSVIKIALNDESTINKLDMDDNVNKALWSKLVEALKYRASQTYSKVPDGKSKRRHNIDGIILELAISKGAIPKPDIIVKETYTAFDKGTLSNFPNGRECAIRNRDLIKSTEICS